MNNEHKTALELQHAALANHVEFIWQALTTGGNRDYCAGAFHGMAIMATAKGDGMLWQEINLLRDMATSWGIE
jgi:hypothetical protein